jgi:cobalamin biosynthesis protein CobT
MSILLHFPCLPRARTACSSKGAVCKVRRYCAATDDGILLVRCVELVENSHYAFQMGEEAIEKEDEDVVDEHTQKGQESDEEGEEEDEEEEKEEEEEEEEEAPKGRGCRSARKASAPELPQASKRYRIAKKK